MTQLVADEAAANNSECCIYYEGWLRKEGRKLKIWKRRYFVLQDECLNYYATPDKTKLLGSIHLRQNQPILELDEPDDAVGIGYNTFVPSTHLTAISGGVSNLHAMSSSISNSLTSFVPSPKLQFTLSTACVLITPLNEKQHVYTLAAHDIDERNRWLHHIRRVMYRYRGGAVFGYSLNDVMLQRTHHSTDLGECCRDHAVPLNNPCVSLLATTRDATMEEDEKGGPNHKRVLPILLHDRSGLQGVYEIPNVLTDCGNYILKYGLEEKGIFRHCGRKRSVLELAKFYDHGLRPDLESSDYEIHTVCGVFKKFFQDLPNPLIPYHHYDSLKSCGFALNAGFHTESIVGQLQRLPEPNYVLLEYLCCFLYLVSSKSKETLMNVDNLSLLFLPSVLRSLDDPIDADEPVRNIVALTFSSLIQQHWNLFPNHVPTTFVNGMDCKNLNRNTGSCLSEIATNVTAADTSTFTTIAATAISINTSATDVATTTTTTESRQRFLTSRAELNKSTDSQTSPPQFCLTSLYTDSPSVSADCSINDRITDSFSAKTASVVMKDSMVTRLHQLVDEIRNLKVWCNSLEVDRDRYKTLYEEQRRINMSISSERNA